MGPFPGSQAVRLSQHTLSGVRPTGAVECRRSARPKHCSVRSDPSISERGNSLRWVERTQPLVPFRADSRRTFGDAAAAASPNLVLLKEAPAGACTFSAIHLRRCSPRAAQSNCMPFPVNIRSGTTEIFHLVKCKQIVLALLDGPRKYGGMLIPFFGTAVRSFETIWHNTLKVP